MRKIEEAVEMLDRFSDREDIASIKIRLSGLNERDPEISELKNEFVSIN